MPPEITIWHPEEPRLSSLREPEILPPSMVVFANWQLCCCHHQFVLSMPPSITAPSLMVMVPMYSFAFSSVQLEL